MIDIPETFRYSAVSALCMVLSLILIPLLSSWGMHYAAATLVAFCLNAIIGFCAHSFWTFQEQFRLSSFIRYVSAIAINFPLTVLLIGTSHDVMKLPIYMSTILSTIILFVWNYIAARWAVVRRGAPQ